MRAISRLVSWMNDDDLLETNGLVQDYSYDLRKDPINFISGYNGSLNDNSGSYPTAEEKKSFRASYDDKLRREATEYMRGNLTLEDDVLSTNPYIDRELSRSQKDFETVQGLQQGNVEYGGKGLMVAKQSVNKTDDTTIVQQEKRRVIPRKTVVNVDSSYRDKKKWRDPNEYEIKFKRTFKNVKSVRLLSTEIPNMEQPVKEFPTELKNNEILWQNKEDRYAQIYCMIAVDYIYETNEMIVECFLNTKNYDDYRDPTTDVNNSKPTRLLIKNCIIKDINGEKYTLKELNGGSEVFDIYKITGTKTLLKTIRLKFNLQEYITNHPGWDAVTVFYICKLRMNTFNDFDLSFYLPPNVSSNLTYALNPDIRMIRYLSNTQYYYIDDQKVLSEYCDVYELKKDGNNLDVFVRNNYECKLYPGNYLGNTISQYINESVKILTVNDDYNIINTSANIDTDIIVSESFENMRIDDKPIILNNDTTLDTYYNEFRKRKIITDFIIVRCLNHNFKNGQKIKFNNLDLSAYGIPSSLLEREVYIELLSVGYRPLENSSSYVDLEGFNLLTDTNTYIKLLDSRYYDLPNILYKEFDSGNVHTPVTENYFLIRTDGNIPNGKYGIHSIPATTNDKDGVGSLDIEIYSHRKFKWLNDSTNILLNNIGYQMIDSFNLVTRQIEEISDYRYESYYSMKNQQMLSLGIKIKMTEHNLQTGDIITITESNSIPSIDGEWRITVLNDDYFLLLPDEMNDSLIFYNMKRTYGPFVPFIYNKTRSSNPVLELYYNDGVNIIKLADIVEVRQNPSLKYSKSLNNLKTSTTFGPLIINVYSIPGSVDLILPPGIDIPNEYFASGMVERLSLVSNDYVIPGWSGYLGGYSIDKTLTVGDLLISMLSNVTISKITIKMYDNTTRVGVRLKFDYYNSYLGYSNYILDSYNQIYQNYRYYIYKYGSTTELNNGLYESLGYMGNYFQFVYWYKGDVHCLIENGNFGYINKNPVKLISQQTTSVKQMELEIKNYNHSLSPYDEVYLSGFLNDQFNFFDDYSAYYIVSSVPDKDHFRVIVPGIFGVKGLDHMIITSKYHGFRDTQTNLDAYGKVQKLISLEGDLYLLMLNDKFDAFKSSDENSKILAKINLSAAPGCMLYDTFVSNPIVFEDTPYSELSSMKIRFVRPDGLPFDFNKQDHSFTLEIVEYVDKVAGSDVSGRRGIADDTTKPSGKIQ